MTKQTTAQALAGQLFAAETAIDAALTETASLIAMFPGARSEALLSAVVGQRAFRTTAAAVSALTEARGQLVATHHTLSALARTMGLEILAVGPLDKPRERSAHPTTATAPGPASHTKVIRLKVN
ncbi:MAG: hypothetical protein EON96_22515 [Caulobacteraceae bacterium]|nr:MAG: hypothetical protein EON96_22515 [Caulobacteraceae bacterium]